MKVSTGIANRLLDYVDGDSVKNVVQPDVDLNEDKFTKTMYNNGLSYYNGLFGSPDDSEELNNERALPSSSIVSDELKKNEDKKNMEGRKEKDYFVEYKLYFMSIPLLLGLLSVLIAYRSAIK